MPICSFQRRRQHFSARRSHTPTTKSVSSRAFLHREALHMPSPMTSGATTPRSQSETRPSLRTPTKPITACSKSKPTATALRSGMRTIPLTGRGRGLTMEAQSSIGATMPTATWHATPSIPAQTAF